MPTEAEQFAERARQQSDAFMTQSRGQMLQLQQEQRAVMMGQGPGFGTARPAYPAAGSPAGRLLETITGLVKQGAAFGGGVASTVAAPVGAAGGAVGGGLGFMMSASPYGPGGIAGGTGAMRELSFNQTMFTAFGGAMPLGAGKFAAQRMDMTRRQAEIMAREELSLRLGGGAREAAYDLANTATLGLFGMGMRRTGREFGARDVEFFARGAQRRARFVTRGDIEEGLGEGMAGPFATGVGLRGARALGRMEAGAMGRIQAQTGINRDQAETMLGQAAGFMGRTGYAEAVRGGNYEQEMETQARAVREIRQTLHLSAEQMKEFQELWGEMHGAATEVAAFARRNRGRAAQWGMSVQEVTEMTRQFRTQGVRMGVGAGAMEESMMATVGNLAGARRTGMITRDELAFYGGQNREQQLQVQAQVRMQQNIAMWQRGGLGGFGTAATQDPRLFQQLMGGDMNFIQGAGAVGGMLAADPFAALRARFDPQQQIAMGRTGARLAFQMTQAQQGMFIGGGENQRAQMIAQFQRRTGFKDMEATMRFEQYEREQSYFRMEGKRGGRTDRQAQQWTKGAQSVYMKSIASGAEGLLSRVMGTGSSMTAAGALYDRLTNFGESELPPNMSIEDMVEKIASAPVTLEDLRGPMAFGVEGLSYLKGRQLTIGQDLGQGVREHQGWLGRAAESVGGWFRGGAKYAGYALAIPTFGMSLGGTAALDAVGSYGRLSKRRAVRAAMTPQNTAKAMAWARDAGMGDIARKEFFMGSAKGLEVEFENKNLLLTAEMDGRVLVETANSRERMTVEQLAEKYDTDTANAYTTQLQNAAQTMLDPQKMKQTLAGYEAEGLLERPEAYILSEFRAQQASKLLGQVVGGDAPGAGMERLDWFARKVAISDEKAIGQYGDSATRVEGQMLQDRLSQSRMFSTSQWSKYVTLEGDEKTGILKWRRDLQGNIQGRIQAMAAMVGNDERAAARLADVFNQAGTAPMGEEAGSWDSDKVFKLFNDQDAMVTQEFEDYTKKHEFLGKELLGALTAKDEKTAEPPAPGSSNAVPLYTRDWKE